MRIEKLAFCVCLAAMCDCAVADKMYSISDCGGVPRLVVDGKPVAAMCALPKPGLPPDRVTPVMVDFASCGVRVFSDVWFGRDRSSSSVGDAGNDWWLGEGRYDFAAFDRRMRALLAASSDAIAFPRIKFDQPAWWIKDHAGELLGSEIRPDSSAWRRLYRRMLTDVIRHVETSDYADRVMGYHLAAMHCGEWLLGSFPADTLPPVTCDRRDPLPDVASTAASRKALAEYPRLIADALLDAAALVKRETDRRKLVGAFFGYMGKWAHDDFARVLRSPDVDFFASPANYGRTRRGGGCASFQAYTTASFRLHGKLYYDEADPRTWLSPQMVSYRCATPEESVNVIKRSLGSMLSGGFETWWFLLGGNESFRSPLLMEPVRTAFAEEMETLRTAPPPTAEVAVFTSASEYSTCAFAHCGDDLMREVCNYDLPQTVFPFAGPHDAYELSDIEEPTLPDYKVYVFVNAFTLSEERRAAIKRIVRRNGKTAVWLLAPGYYRNGAGGASNVVDLTGVDVVEVDPLAENRVSRLSRTFEVADAAGPVKTFSGGWRSVYFPTPPSVGDLRRAYAEAGVHLWTDTPEVVAAGRGYLTVHATCDGEKTIRLPGLFDAREIYGAAPERKAVRAFREKMKKGDTRTYRLFDLSKSRVTADLSGEGWTLTEADGRAYPVSIPHSWNVEDGCDGKEVLSSERYAKNASCMNSYERKRVVYSRSLPDARPGRRYFVKCGGASITATVSVNGRVAGTHLGAFTAFCFEVTDLMKSDGNVLEIAVDNFSRDDVAPPVNADFTMYGGLYRDVQLIETPEACIDPVTDGASGVRLFPDPGTGRVKAEIKVLGAPDETREFSVPGFRLWSPETPVVYTQRFEIASGDAVVETFAFRKAEFREDGFYLNGRKRFLRGVNYHQDREGRGWAVSRKEIADDISAMKELGADALRTAHYPHSGFTYSQCDEKGLVVWCEQPNVNGLRFTDAFRSNCWRQTREMVMQLRNHPSIVCWSIFNELYNKVPMREGDPEAMMEELRDYVAALDPSRPVSAACSFPDKKRLNAIAPVMGFNRYPGWYGGPADDMTNKIDEICTKNSRSTFGMTEYGAGGSPNQHDDPLQHCEADSSWHTEEYQAYVHARGYRALVSDPRVWGAFVWCMFDYGSDRRLEGEKWGRNDKGLLTFDHATKKDAWHLYAANWSGRPTLHLVGSRTPQGTTNETLNVLGFSNVGDVELKINGRSFGTRSPDAAKAVLWESVPLELGTNRIALAADGLTATNFYVRVKALNYDPAKIGEVRLEDPLAFADGRKLASPAEWPARRAEILELLQREMYGRIPERIEPVVDVIDEGVTVGGYATRRLLRMYFRKDRTGPCVNWLVVIPRHAKRPSPAILFLNYGGNHELLFDSEIPVPKCWMRPAPGFRRYGERATAATRGLYADHGLRTVYPVGMLVARGFAIATACYCEISPDWHGRVLDGNYRSDDVLSLFPFDSSRMDNVTALGAWAWTLMRGMDALENMPEIDARRVAVVGSSRLAKAALLAGAFDERFFAVIPNQTGGGGCPLLKRNYGENAESLVRNFPHWFAAEFRKYAENEKSMPFDSHLLMACVAPRKLLVEGFGDPLYDTEGEFLAARAASPVWKFLGGEGLPDVSFPEPYDVSAIGRDLGYVRRTERHGLAAVDWTWIMDFLVRD